DVVIFLTESPLVHDLVLQESSISGVQDLHFLHHLRYDYLNVLIVDFHTLKSVDFLNFIDQVLLNSSRAFDRKDVVWRDRSIRQGLASANEVILLHQDVLRKRYHVLLDYTILGFDDDLSVTTLDTTISHHTVDLRYHSRVGWVTSFEQFSYSWKTTGDITGLPNRSWDLHQDLS